MSAVAYFAPPSANTSARSEAELLKTHYDLVRRVAYHIAARLPSSVDIEDLVQSGVIGLIEAARHFSGDRGASFETYATIRIRGAIMDELRRGDWAPRSVHRRHREISGAMRAIEQRTGREAREDEIIAEMGISPSDYHSALQDAVQCHVLSLHGGGDGDGDDHELDAVDPTADPYRDIEREHFRKAMIAAIGALPERERLVLALYYDEELNLREIGAVLGVTESRVCQIHGQALLRLRSRLAEWRAAQGE